MSRSVIGALRVHLGIDTAQFQAGLSKASQGVDRFAKTAAKVGAAVGAAIAGATAVVSMAVRSAINEADTMAKAAQKFGVPVDELTRLKHAADLSGVSLDGLGTGMRVLSRNMVEFANGAKNSASQAFQQLGIEVKNADGTMKSSTQVITEIAGKLSMMQDGAQKTALAMALFGRSGADLLPMLNAGASGLAEMMAEADRLGIVLDSNTGKSAEAFNDNLTRLGRVKDGLIMKLTAQLLPALEGLSEQFLDFVNNESAVTATGHAIQSVFEGIARVSMELVRDIRRLSAELRGLGGAWNALTSGEGISAAWDAWREGAAESDRILNDMNARIESGIFSGSSQGQIQRRISAAFGDAGTQAGETLLEAIEVTSGKGGGRIRKAIDPLAQEASRVFDQTRNSVERYHMQLDRLRQLLAAGAIDQDTYNRAVIQAQDAFDQAEQAGKKAEGTFANIGQTMAWSFSSAFQGILDGSKKVGDAIADLMRQFSNMLLNSAFQSLFGAGGGSGGGIFSGFMKAIGFRANGGPVSAGRPYIVGERGPELMVPNSSGSVVRNADLAGVGGGSSFTYAPKIDARGADSAAVARLEQVIANDRKQFEARVTATVRKLPANRMGR